MAMYSVKERTSGDVQGLRVHRVLIRDAACRDARLLSSIARMKENERRPPAACQCFTRWSCCAASPPSWTRSAPPAAGVWSPPPSLSSVSFTPPAAPCVVSYAGASPPRLSGCLSLETLARHTTPTRKRKAPQAWWAKAPTQVPCFEAQRTVYALGRPAPPPAHRADASDTGETHFALVRPTPPFSHTERPKEAVYTRGVHFLDVSQTLHPPLHCVLWQPEWRYGAHGCGLSR